MANPIVAAILSALIPGLGQFYAGNLMRGIIVFLIAVFMGTIVGVITFFTFFGFIAGIIPLIFWIWNIYDAYKLA